MRLLAALLVVAIGVWSVALLRERRATPARRHVEAAVAATRAGESRRAEREWRAAIALQPRDPALWEQLGELYLSTGDWPGATEAFRELLSLAPGTPDLHGRLAACALRSGDEVAAYRYAREALSRDPDSVAALAVGAHLFANTGEEQERLRCLRALVRQLPEDRDFLTLLAEALVEQHLYDEARPIVARLLERDPSHADAYAWRAVVALNTRTEPRAQSPEPSRRDLYRSLRLNPTAPFPRLVLGKLYRRQGRLDRALFQFEQAFRFAPERLDVLYELGEAYAAAGVTTKAADARRQFAQRRRAVDRERLLEQRSAAYRDEASYPRELGLLCLRTGDIRKASFFLRRALTLAPGDAAVRAGLDRLERGRGLSVNLSPSLSPTRGGKMDVSRSSLISPSDSPSPRRGGGRGERSIPDRPAAWHYENGVRRLHVGDAAGATIAWRTAIALDPAFPEPYRALAEQRAASGDFITAAGVLERLGRANPNAPHILCRRAELYLRAGLFVQVIPIARDARSREPGCGVAHRVRNALRIEADHADAARRSPAHLRHAIVALRQARRRYLARPDRHTALHLATLEAQRGNRSDASFLARTVLRNDPDDGAALDHLYRLRPR